jgi:hypothetical protein
MQASMLNRTFGCVRVVWNRTLAWRQQRYHAEKATTTYAQASAYLTAMKVTEDLTWLNEVSSVPLQQAIRHQQAAYTAFFAKRPGIPGSSPGTADSAPSTPGPGSGGVMARCSLQKWICRWRSPGPGPASTSPRSTRRR